MAAGKHFFIAFLECLPTPNSLFSVMLYFCFPSKCHLKITKENGRKSTAVLTMVFSEKLDYCSNNFLLCALLHFPNVLQ